MAQYLSLNNGKEKVLKMTTKILPVTDLRRDTSRVLQAVQEQGDVVYITQHGRAAAVLLDFEHYQALLAQLEDLSDLVAIEDVAGEKARSYEEFLAEMQESENA
jgi:prevent-host-death family protein